MLLLGLLYINHNIKSYTLKTDIFIFSKKKFCKFSQCYKANNKNKETSLIYVHAQRVGLPKVKN